MSYKHKSRAGFTLVELLVSLVIISILAALSLSGLSAVRRRSREEATRTTIRKIHEIIVPQYESYLDKRLDRASCITIGGSAPSSVVGTRRRFEWGKLVTIRKTLAFEMPDNWGDVGSVPTDYGNGRTEVYASYETGNIVSNDIDSAECLYMICQLSGFQPEAMENFRAEEIGDKDGDGKLEFHDAWGMPIAFIRWPTGFDGPITLNQETDPFDPESIDTSIPSSSPPRFLPGVVPLIYSAGLDQEYGLAVAQAAGVQSDANVGNFNTVTATSAGHFASSLPGNASQDNISNHDLITR